MGTDGGCVRSGRHPASRRHAGRRGRGRPTVRPLLPHRAAWWSYGTLYNALYDYSGEDPTKAAPQLAESDEETDTTLTVKLRQGVKFHNGREFGAQDVVDNIERAKDEDRSGTTLPRTSYQRSRAPRSSIHYTVKITYKKPYALKRDDLATLFILPKEAMADIATNPVGTGPFKFVSFAPVTGWSWPASMTTFRKGCHSSTP